MTNQERQLNEDFSFLLSQMTDEQKKKILRYLHYLNAQQVKEGESHVQNK